MANTTNFNWETPDDTDLVKDGAAAIRTLGSAIDTSLVDLKGGTTGQVLSKATNTDMDFTWITNDVGDITAVTAGTGISGGGTSGAVTITNSMATEIAAKGDLIVGTGSATFDNLTVGANGTVLTADSTVSPTGLKWATPSAASFVGCSIYKVTTAQSLANNTDTVISFNAEEFDTDGFHDNSVNNSRITIPTGKGGKYLIIAALGYATNSTGTRSILIYLNGAQLYSNMQVSASSSFTTRLSTTAIVNLNATDYLEVAGSQSSGGSLDVLAGSGSTRFAVIYLGA